MSKNTKQDKVKKRIAVRKELEELEGEIKILKDNIEGKEKLADNDWRLYKQTGNKKYFFRANKQYKEWNEMKASLCELEKEKEYVKNKWRQLKLVA